MSAEREYNPIDLAEMMALEAVDDPTTKVYRAAKMYAEAGFYVLPIVKNGKAIPPKKYQVSYAHAARSSKTIDKWFNPDDGVFKGWNIGLATGKQDGIFVIDVDRHGDVNGFNTLAEIMDKEKVKMPECPVQITPNKGKHYVFSWQENASSSTGKIGPGIDTRGGLENICKGHVVVFPSTINGKRYLWESGGPVPPIPEWVAHKLGVPWQNKGRGPEGSGRGNENITSADVEEEVPLDQIETMLNHINPNDLEYEDWLRVGMSIKSQHPNEEGLAIWDEWSSSGDRYESKECIKRWTGFSEMGAVRVATLFHFAKQGGWEPKPTDKKVNKLASVTEEMNVNHAIVVTGNKIRILKELTGDIEEMSTTYHLLTRQDFCNLYENNVICTDPDKMKFTSKAVIWLGDPIRRTYEKGLGMFPEGEPEGYYNTWQGFNCKPTKGDCDKFKYHIYSVLCECNEELYNYVLDWCADLFQDPANPKGTAIVMRGDEGTGKGTFANTIGMMCAPHYTHLIDENHLTGQFNAHMVDSIVVFADEITWGGNRKTAGKLKGLVTERHMLLERKGIDAVSQRNMVHMLIASNSKWVIPAGMNSRRWLVLDVSDSQRCDRNYFIAVNNELDNGGREAFLYEMLNRKIESNLAVALVTEALEDQRSMSMVQDDTNIDWWSRKLAEKTLLSEDLDDANNVGWPSTVRKSDLYAEYETWCMDRNARPQMMNIFAKDMVKYGLISTRKRMGEGNRVYAYKMNTHKKMIDKFNMITGLKLETENEE